MLASAQPRGRDRAPKPYRATVARRARRSLVVALIVAMRRLVRRSLRVDARPAAPRRPLSRRPGASADIATGEVEFRRGPSRLRRAPADAEARLLRAAAVGEDEQPARAARRGRQAQPRPADDARHPRRPHAVLRSAADLLPRVGLLVPDQGLHRAGSAGARGDAQGRARRRRRRRVRRRLAARISARPTGSRGRTSIANLAGARASTQVPVVVQYNKRDLPEAVAARRGRSVRRCPSARSTRPAPRRGRASSRRSSSCVGRAWDCLDADLQASRAGSGSTRPRSGSALAEHVGVTEPGKITG